jgi:hypothetical protein
MINTEHPLPPEPLVIKIHKGDMLTLSGLRLKRRLALESLGSDAILEGDTVAVITPHHIDEAFDLPNFMRVENYTYWPLDAYTGELGTAGQASRREFRLVVDPNYSEASAS